MKQFKRTGLNGTSFHDAEMGLDIPDDMTNRHRIEMQRLLDAGEAELLPADPD